MRKILFLVAIATMFLSINLYPQNNTVERYIKETGLVYLTNLKSDSYLVSGTKAPWDIAFTFDAVEGTHVGIETDGTNFYTCSWLWSGFASYNMDGTFIETFTITDVNPIRDLTYDGTYFYGLNDSMTIYVLDLANKTLIGTIPVTCTGVTVVRHIAYDPNLDNGNGGFWVGNWSKLGAVSMTGDELVAPSVILDGCFGIAYDPYTDADNPCLWLFQQLDGTSAVFYQYDINTMSMTGVTHDCSDVPGFMEGIAGGACTYTSDGVAYLVANIQQEPNLIVVYELATTNTDPDSDPITELPYFEDFEGEFPPVGWSFVNTHPISDSNWHQGEGNSSAGALEVFWVNSELMDEWAISPTFDLSGISSDIEFSFDFLASYIWQVEADGADIMVKVSTDGGTNWTQIWREEDFGVFENWVWSRATVPFTEFAGEPNVKFAFHYLGSDGAQVSIDNVKLDYATGIDEDVSVNVVSVYPNPSDGLVNVKVVEKSVVTVVDISGRTVGVYNVDANETLSFKQASGMYILKVLSEGKASSHKLIVK